MEKMFVLSQRRLKAFPHIVAIVMLALVYYGSAEISRNLAATPQSVTPVWPPDGFASAAVLLWGYQILPGVLIGSFLANIWAFFNGASWYAAIASVLQVLGIAIGSTAGAGIGNYLLRRAIKGRNPLKRLEDVYKFLGLMAVLAPTINATSGVISLCLGGKIPWSMFGMIWMTWWVSNAAGICIFTPALLSWKEWYFNIINERVWSDIDKKLESHRTNFWNRSVEAIVLVAVVIGLSFLSFYGEYNLEYMLIPCLVWAVLRFGQLLATNLIVIITTIAVLGTVKGIGTFAFNHPNNSLILLQSFIIVIVVTTLSLIAILTEKEQAIANLQQSKLRLLDKSAQLEKSKSSLDEASEVLEQKNIALTEAKRIAEAANRTKSEFLSNMSHELRTPLNAILGLGQLLQDSKNLDPQEKADIQTVCQSGNHLLSLIDDILDISKIEAGKMNLHLEEVYLANFLNHILEIIQVQANQKDIEFVYHFSHDLPKLIVTDEKRLRQVLLNLLSNAVKFTDKGHVIFRVISKQSIAIDTAVSNHFVLIDFEIEDSGIGIESSNLESIFFPFEQVGEIKFKTQGTGLGLAISQKIAEMMGSKIIVRSQRNVGSVFRLTISLEVPEERISTQPHVLIENNRSIFEQNLALQMPLSILLAEDNVVNQKVACKILNKLGYEIDIANNGLKVLEAMRDRDYDVILMDVQMPEMDGLEATECIVKNENLLQRPYIIAMTANAMDGDRAICLSAGMDDYISKPVKVDLLVAALLRSQNSGKEAGNLKF